MVAGQDAGSRNAGAGTTEAEMNRLLHAHRSTHGSPLTGTALAAGAGLAAGLAANYLRKAVMQAPAALAGNWDQALTEEHKMVLSLFDKLEEIGPAYTSKRAVLFSKVKQALAKHAFQEENVVYPALRDHGAEEAANSLNRDHGYVKQFLFDLGGNQKEANWMNKLREFRTLLERHMTEEEQEIFPQLKAQLSEQENRAVTIAMTREGSKLM